MLCPDIIDNHLRTCTSSSNNNYKKAAAEEPGYCCDEAHCVTNTGGKLIFGKGSRLTVQNGKSL